jgi:hypothetical protein
VALAGGLLLFIFRRNITPGLDKYAYEQAVERQDFETDLEAKLMAIKAASAVATHQQRQQKNSSTGLKKVKICMNTKTSNFAFLSSASRNQDFKL